MGITHYPLPKNIGNLLLPFFGGNDPIFLLDNIYQWLYMYINWFNWILYFHDHICYREIGGSNNFPNDLNGMVNYDYHSENRVITH